MFNSYTDEVQVDEKINKQTIIEMFNQEQRESSISDFLNECKQSGVLQIIKD